MNVAEATKQINNILRDLEVSTGLVVESIELRDLDVTTVEGGPEILRSVQIEMKRPPVQNGVDNTVS
jgi:hypothetical protein